MDIPVVLKDYIPYSPIGKALVLLHEGYHAKIFMKNPYEGRQNDRDYCYEEVEVHNFQNKVMSLLGGEKYRAILDKEVKRIRAMTSMGKSGFSMPMRAEYEEGLAEAFGKPPASEQEKDFIQTSVWIHAVFIFLDNKFKEGADEQKALFLRSMYKEDGII